MKVSGFTFIRNGVKYDYPFLESIQSILPICDEMVIAVGNCGDNTRDLILKLDKESKKIKIIDTVWDENLREGGGTLAQQTDIAMDQISGDWGFYLQGDEVLHEKYREKTLEMMKKYLNDQRVEGLLFHYRHFYGSYRYIGNSRRWYRREVRVVRSDKSIRSYKDAQGFRKNGRKLRVKLIPCEIYHYGWVKSPKVQQQKQKYFNKLWHDDTWVQKNVGKKTEYDYNSKIDSLELFEEEHPAVMSKRINRDDWDFVFQAKRIPLGKRILNWIEKLTGIRLGEYRNYKII